MQLIGFHSTAQTHSNKFYIFHEKNRTKYYNVVLDYAALNRIFTLYDYMFRQNKTLLFYVIFCTITDVVKFCTLSSFRPSGILQYRYWYSCAVKYILSFLKYPCVSHKICQGMSLGTRQYIINYNTCILDSLTHTHIQRTFTHTHTHIQRTFIHTHTYIYKKIVLRVDRTGFTRNLGKHEAHTHIYIYYIIIMVICW